MNSILTRIHFCNLHIPALQKNPPSSPKRPGGGVQRSFKYGLPSCSQNDDQQNEEHKRKRGSTPKTGTGETAEAHSTNRKAHFITTVFIELALAESNSHAALPNSGSQDDDQQHEKHKSKRSCTYTAAKSGTGKTNSHTHIHHHRLFDCDGLSLCQCMCGSIYGQYNSTFHNRIRTHLSKEKTFVIA
jgi:hypothetical protein